ncbi:MAG: hypothetical protein HGGPFJEG_01586 [Ignavibacteria bacterium]|nr:hypothetical protein [Ignavibacteria bacterium]
MKKKKFDASEYFLLFIVLFFSIGYILFPLYTLVSSALNDGNGNFGFSNFLNAFTKTTFQAAINSILLSLITVALSGITGLVFAYILHFQRIRTKSFFSSLLMIPLATPPLIGVVSFLFLLNEKGLLANLLELVFKHNELSFKFDGWSAIVIVHVYSFFPLFYLFTSSALKRIDSNLIDASYSLGASKTLTFFKVILPLLIPSVVGASLITFMASMASFSAPFIFGGSERFLTTEIYFAKINGDNSLASSIAVLLTIISIIFFILLRRYRTGKLFDIRHKGVPRTDFSSHRSQTSISGTIIISLFSLMLILPVFTLLYLSFIPEGSLMRNFLSESFTPENYLKIFSEPQFFEPFYNSLMMSLIAVLITLIAGISSAYLIAKVNTKFKSIIENIVSIPYGIPGTVIALSLILSFNKPVLFGAFTPLVGTFIIIPLAYSIRNIPILMQSSMSGFYSLDPSLEEASFSLGAGKMTTFGKVIFPLIFPSVLNGALLVFINSAGEFVSTILLYSYSTKTISVEIYSQIRMYNTGAAAAYGMLLFAVVMAVVYVSRKTIDKSITGI